MFGVRRRPYSYGFGPRRGFGFGPRRGFGFGPRRGFGGGFSGGGFGLPFALGALTGALITPPYRPFPYYQPFPYYY